MALVPQPLSFPSSKSPPRPSTLLLGAAPRFGVRSPAAVGLRGRAGAQGIAPMRGALRDGWSLNTSFPSPYCLPRSCSSHSDPRARRGKPSGGQGRLGSWSGLVTGNFWLRGHLP